MKRHHNGRFVLLLSLLLLFECINGWKKHTMHGFYDLPVLPAQLPPVTIFNESTNKFIPQKLWIAVKDKHEALPGHLHELFRRNPRWEVIICDNHCKDDFLYGLWGNTSVAWAYSVLNPLVGAARADIWRYAVLYTYGGMYLDDDSTIGTPLDEVVSSTDRLILTEEGSSSLGDCYIPTYSLSETATYQKYPNYSQAVHYHGLVMREGQGIKRVPAFFHDHTLVNWGLFTRPRHPLFLRTLSHIVEIITSEYRRVSVIHLTRWEVKWKTVMCATGFVLTYSLRELELENSLAKEDIPRICSNNFQEYRGNVKAIWTGGDASHYMKAMTRKGGPHLLREFGPLNLPLVLQFLEGRTVMGDGGKQIFLVKEGKLRSFPSYDLFLKMKFSDREVRYVSDHLLNLIPQGGDLTDSDAETTPPPPSTTSTTPATITSQRRYYERSSYPDLSSAASQTTLQTPFFSTSHPIYPYLSQVKQELDSSNQSEVTCFGDDYDGSRDDLLRDRYQSLFAKHAARNPQRDSAVLVFPFCLRTFQLGNSLGYYLNDLACADLAGSHFLAVRPHFEIQDPSALLAPADQQLAFFHHLPSLVIHPQPKPVEEVKQVLKLRCHCLQFCWENSEAPWLSRLSLLPRVLLPAINAYTAAANAERIGTILSNLTDTSTLPLDAALPLVPNVTIQYRCGDNIGFGRTKYGLLPFSVFTRFHRIPHELARFIYVIADSPTRSINHPYSYRCDAILKRLFEYLVKAFPKAVVVIKRGGDPFLDYTRIAYSQVVFCSASTFCLWPALSNLKGQVYYPLTPLVARAATNETAPDFGPRFHWISEVAMIKEFKQYRPWHRLIDDLETRQ